MCFERKFTNYFIKTKILTVFIDEDSLPVVAFMVRTSLRQEIFICIGGEVRCCAGLAAEGLAVMDLLQVVQPTGDALVAVGVESVEVDAGTAIHTGVNLGAGQDRIAVSVYDSGSRSGVGIDEVAASVSRIIRTLGVTVTERRLDSGESRYGATVALELGLTFLGAAECAGQPVGDVVNRRCNIPQLPDGRFHFAHFAHLVFLLSKDLRYFAVLSTRWRAIGVLNEKI